MITIGVMDAPVSFVCDHGQEKALPEDTTMPDKDEKESSYSLTGRAQSGTAYYSIVQTSVERTIVRLQLRNSKSFCFVSDIASGPMDCLKHLKLSGENFSHFVDSFMRGKRRSI